MTTYYIICAVSVDEDITPCGVFAYLGCELAREPKPLVQRFVLYPGYSALGMFLPLLFAVLDYSALS